LVIAGDGSNLEICKKLAKDVANPRILFYSPWPRSDTSKALSAADILVLPTRGLQSLASIPSKLIPYMLAARPILALAMPKSDLAQIICAANCGWVVRPDKPGDLAVIIKNIVYLSKDVLRLRGRAGRDYAVSNFTADVCLRKVAAIIASSEFA